MDTMPVRTALVTAALATLAGCGDFEGRHGPRDIQTHRQAVELQGAEMVRVEITMGAGELSLSGGAKSLMEGEFRYASPGKPEIDYNATSFRGRLIVRSPANAPGVGKAENKWDLRLNETVPLDLHVKMGAGEGRLNVGALTLRSVEVEMGAGELNLDLSGAPKRTVDVRVRGGVGQANVRVPRDVGVEAEVHGGIGDIDTPGFRARGDHRYVNRASEDGKPTMMRLDIRGGVGQVKLVGD